MGDAANRLKLARERAGFATAAEAAQRFGWRESTYFGHENGSRGVRPDVASRYARAFRVSSSWLLYGEGEPGTPDIATIDRLVPVLGEVRAGVWTEVTEGGSVEQYIPVYLPEFQRADLYALHVVGRSMDRFYPDGSWVVVCPTAQAGVHEGDHVIVLRHKRGLVETTIKEVRRGEAGGVELWPQSNDPAHQAPIVVNAEHDADEGVEITGRVVAQYAIRPASRGPIISL